MKNFLGFNSIHFLALAVGFLSLLTLSKTHTVSAQGEKSLSPKRLLSSANEQAAYVAVLSTGIAPRQVLSFHPATNSKQSSQMIANLKVDAKTDNKPAPLKAIPELTVDFDTTVKKVDPNGDIYYQQVYTSVSEHPTGSKAKISKSNALAANSVIDKTGLVKSSQVETEQDVGGDSKKVLHQVSDLVQKSSIRFPAIPIGSGAKWRTKLTVNQDGVNILKTTTYELVKLQANVATVHIISEGQTSKQSFSSVGINPGGIKMPVRSLSVHEEGQATMRLDRLLPLSETWVGNTISQTEFSDPNSDHTMTLDLTTKINIALKSI